ncbi:M14 family zinc carboxypeptidase [Actinokineospora sp. NBRC 105648]|uniref:M14 family zinc carboxypeptidase n=1 Tax=Actinokineospora sp. NBRC 105648 TaxID=3032206 RepID=UPI0024A2244E|nr:M14 family zinc carboxypeptidase [Actinokineospora sp. NBRC 105648]GLZ43042.1 peptidase M14 [Actinokineospora sp. NBRC 105648]
MTTTRRSVLAMSVAAAATAAMLAGAFPGASAAPVSEQAGAYSARHAQTYLYRVPGGAARADDLLRAGFDVLEEREGDDLFVMGRADVGDRLRAAGHRARVEQALDPVTWAPPARSGQAPVLDAAVAEETYYGGYRTVNAQFAHLDQVARDHAALATVVDYGDSWRKSRGSGGYDLKAICITKKNAGDCALSTSAPKPRLFVMGQLHAREITTGDVAYRWIDHLTDGYGTDAEVTALLDSTEVWVVPIANPDGVDIVQRGGSYPYLQRKNANNTNGAGCGTTGGSSQVGIDLNRNTSSGYGTGSSTQPCAETYRGPSANSEVEVRALQSLWRSLYRDRRATGTSAPAPADTTGMVISMHSYSNMVLFPWGFNSAVKSGNDTSLRAIARQMATIAGTGWRYGQPGEILYNAGGATDDWVYDDLGVSSFVWEIGGSSGSCSGFLPAYSCQSSTYWPKVKAMLLYSAKKAKNPYTA